MTLPKRDTTYIDALNIFLRNIQFVEQKEEDYA